MNLKNQCRAIAAASLLGVAALSSRQARSGAISSGIFFGPELYW